ncbi:hypothetical protein ACRTEE_18435 [Vibrio alginolyticus]|uniref:hypothetical protein n=1 Tax=Vibrio alginolyticus TaxID=663 RepID=UPI003D7EFB12
MNYADTEIIKIFKEQDGMWTLVELENEQCYRVLNIAWGYDMGDKWAHITTNISPGEDGVDVDFFYTFEIKLLRDEKTNKVLFKAA